MCMGASRRGTECEHILCNDMHKRGTTLACSRGDCQAHASHSWCAVGYQVQCTHPRSDSRVKMLTEELDMMKQHGDTALDRVMHPVSYWSL